MKGIKAGGLSAAKYVASDEQLREPRELIIAVEQDHFIQSILNKTSKLLFHVKYTHNGYSSERTFSNFSSN